MRSSSLRAAAAIVVASGLVLTFGGVAIADNVQNDVVAGGNDTFTAGGSTTVNYRIAANSGDGQTGCNAADGSSAIVTINAPAGVTPTPSSLTFTSCGTDKEVVFSSSTPGDYDITVTVSDSGTGTYGTNPAKLTLHVVAASDTTAPVITPNIIGTFGNNGWYVSNVNLTWTVVDNESAITSQSGCGEVNIVADQAATTYTCQATSSGGTASQSVTIKRDATAPTLNPTVSPNPVLFNGTATADPNANDNLSGVASSSCGSVDTSSVGANSVTCSAEDNAGNTNTATANYSVQYGFIGFTSPVDNPGLQNVAKAGQAIPLKWRLVDANNSPVTNLTSAKVTVTSNACALGTTADQLEEYASGSSGLQNLGDGYYQLNWKTPTTYAKSCKTMNLDLGDGSNRTALFQFTR